MLKRLAVGAMACTLGFLCGIPGTGKAPVPNDVSVHDPSMLKADGMYYVFGSHLTAAKSRDLVEWTLIASGVVDGNPLIPNATTEMAETLSWAQSKTFWAPDVIRLNNGKFIMYYCACKGDSPRSALGMAVSDRPEGPYRNLGIILKSGMWGQPGADGTVYDAAVHPNTVDPDAFTDKDGNLWLVYGSYSGGIFILGLDPDTGFPFANQGYGRRLTGGNHCRIEGPCILYSPETGYYYLFLSYGGLDSNGGYNIRVARSRKPDGPYTDAMGKDMREAAGAYGTLFDDNSIMAYGSKLMGNHQWGNGLGYVSPGHNSVYRDPVTKESFIVFHTRFPGKGETHAVRVHRMLMNKSGWPVVAPLRYTPGDTLARTTQKDAAGTYELVNHGFDISKETKRPDKVLLSPNGKVSGGGHAGKWTMSDPSTFRLAMDGTTYTGVMLRQGNALTLTAMSDDGISVWGMRIKEEKAK